MMQILQKLVYEKFYIHEIAAVYLSKIYFLKNAMKTCKPNNRDLNRDWINSSVTFSFVWLFYIFSSMAKYNLLTYLTPNTRSRPTWLRLNSWALKKKRRKKIGNRIRYEVVLGFSGSRVECYDPNDKLVWVQKRFNS